MIERGSFSVLDALLYMIRNWTEATSQKYERAILGAGDFRRESGKELSISAVLGSFKHEALVEGIRQRALQKREKDSED